MNGPVQFMRRTLIAAAVGVLLLAYAPLRAEDLVFVRFSDYIESLRVQTGIPGLAAAIVGRSDVLWENGFGYQDVGRAVRMRPDTPTHADGLTQTVTAALLLRCAEDNRLSLDTAVGTYKKDAPEPAATIKQLLSNTFGPSLFSYRPERLDAVAPAVKVCAGDSHRETVANLLEQLAMFNSVPGPDILTLQPPAEGLPTDVERVQYAQVLDRLAVAYAVDSAKRVYPTQFAASTLTPSTGLITSVHDYAQFDLALRNGIILSPDSLATAWTPAGADATGRPLPYGLGWFIQTYNGELVVWQFGIGGDNGSSSMSVALPARGVTLVMLANSAGLAKSFQLDKGDVTTSPFARIFLSLFTR
ncbi:MAG: serine hydrolase domain-containing protein [Vicinamibacterales bacterium]